MDPFSITVGAVTLIASCRQICLIVEERYRAFSSAEQDVLENMAKLDVMWTKADTQMRLIRHTWSDLEPALQVTLQRAIAILENKLQNASRMLNKLFKDNAQDRTPYTNSYAFLGKSSEVKKIKYVLLPKDTLKDLVKDFQSWADLFDPSWYLIARLSSHDIDKQLKATGGASLLQFNINPSTLSVPSEKSASPIQSLMQLRKATRDLSNTLSDGTIPLPSILITNSQRIPHSTTSTANIPSRDAKLYVVDRIRPHPSADEAETLLSIKRLAKALTRMDPSTFGLLRCIAVSDASTVLGKSNAGLAYDIALEIPMSLASTTPQSLRALLLSNRHISINARLSIAKSLATSLLYLSTMGFVHKSIRSDNVLVFHTPNNESTNELNAFLVGFESFRLAAGTTYRGSDELLRNDIYRHPQRQGRDPERRYHLGHDVYSLGIVLLEIGLWMGLVDESGQIITKKDSDSFRRDAVLSEEVLMIPNVAKRAAMVQCNLMDSNRLQLPSYMGQKYSTVVEKCLNNEDWEVNEGESDLAMSVQYVEEVLSPLHMILI